MMDFLLLLFVITLWWTVFHALENEIRFQVDYQTALFDLESRARMLDALTSSFPHSISNLSSVYRVDKGRLLVSTGDRWVIVETLSGVYYEKEAV